MNKQPIDTVLIKQALRGDQAAYKSLYELYKQRLFVICLRYAKERNIAQDYLQESFISIFKNLNQFDPNKGSFEPWAKRIAINTCLMDIRKQSLYAIGLNGAEHIESNEVGVLSELSLKEMLALIQQLPLGYRTIFNMYVIDGYTHKEIAGNLNISISTSKSQLMKARHLLQKKIITQQQTFNQEHG